MIRISGHGQCTANFAFTNATGEVLLGTAAHCVEHDVGTDVYLDERDALASNTFGPRLGTVTYSAWETIGVTGETCYVILSCSGHPNDFALVDVRDELEDDVRPGLYTYGGPTDVRAAEDVAPLDRVASFGNSSLRPGPDAADRHQGIVQQRGGTYTAYVNFDNPGIPGDSGSPVLTEHGEALGVLVTLGAGYNGVAMLDPALAFAEDAGEMGELELMTSQLTTPLFDDLPIAAR